MSLPRYPKYTDSGVEWLGAVPDHWRVVSLSRLTLSKCDGPFGSGLKSEHYCEAGVRVIRLQNIRNGRFSDSDAVFVAPEYYRSELSGHEVQRGDLLIAGLGDDTHTVGRACVAPVGIEPAMVKADCFRFRLSADAAPEFVAYALCSTSVADAGTLATGTTRSRVPLSAMATRRIALPPLDEQVRIVDFLEGEAAQIDALISEQQRLMELLKEKRQAVISHAVTKGLNQKAPMKPSGVGWLGDVPDHWSLLRIKHGLCGLTDTEHRTAPFFDEGDYLVVRTTNVKNGKLVLDGAKFTDGDGYEDWTRRGKPLPGDVIFTREAPAGEACLVPSDLPLCLGQRTVLMHIRRDVLDPEFVVWAIYGGLAAEFIAILSQGAAVAHLNMSDIRNIPLVVPPLSEQKDIVAFLSAELENLDVLAATAQRAIELLLERRSALTSASVTGQIDLRTLAEAVGVGVSVGSWRR